MTAEERQALTERINRLAFCEYKPVGWFKVVALPRLRKCLHSPADLEWIDRYLVGTSTDAVQRAVVRLFLGEWLVGEVPESIGAWGLDPDEFRAIDRPVALAAINAIVEASMSVPGATIGGCVDWLKPASPDEAHDVPYAQLRSWFVELFAAPQTTFFLHDAPGGPTLRFNVARPRIIGLAPDVVGMFWQE
jgi:hypothetical protein